MYSHSNWKRLQHVSVIFVILLFISGCSSTSSEKKEVTEKDWFVEVENEKKINKPLSVKGVTVTIEKIKEIKNGVEIWWKATSEITDKTNPNPDASFAMGFDPAPLVEITSQKGMGMIVYDRFDQLHMSALDEVKHTPQDKKTFSGYAFFEDIGIVDVNKIVVEDVILDLPVEVEFKVNLPPKFEGILPLDLKSDITGGKVTLRNLKITPKETVAGFKVEPDPSAESRLTDLTGVTVYGQEYYDLKEALGEDFRFEPLGAERDYVVKVWKASYRITGPWEWVIKK